MWAELSYLLLTLISLLLAYLILPTTSKRLEFIWPINPTHKACSHLPNLDALWSNYSTITYRFVEEPFLKKSKPNTPLFRTTKGATQEDL